MAMVGIVLSDQSRRKKVKRRKNRNNYVLVSSFFTFLLAVSCGLIHGFLTGELKPA
jgi:hypothetical protein